MHPASWVQLYLELNFGFLFTGPMEYDKSKSASVFMHLQVSIKLWTTHWMTLVGLIIQNYKIWMQKALTFLHLPYPVWLTFEIQWINEYWTTFKVNRKTAWYLEILCWIFALILHLLQSTWWRNTIWSDVKVLKCPPEAEGDRVKTAARAQAVRTSFQGSVRRTAQIRPAWSAFSATLMAA